MPLYALVATAVYDHGVVGVFSSEELAREAAQEVWITTDGHHNFRIDVLEQDKVYPDVFDHYGWADDDPERMAEKRRRRNLFRTDDVSEIEINDQTKTHDPA